MDAVISRRGRPLAQIANPFTPMKTLNAVLIIALASSLCPSTLAVAAAETAATPSSHPLAWVRFVDGPERFEGTPYRWLGDGELRVRLDVPPQRGHMIELHWGAKADERSALLVVNGQSVPLKAGGYSGFRWLRVPVPASVSGERYDLAIKTDTGKAAFLAEIRLTAPDAASAQADLQQAAFKASAVTTPKPAAEIAFPEMRKVWDREPHPSSASRADARTEAAFRQAERNARLANEAFFRCRRYIDGWLAHADPATGLIPRNLNESRDYWNGRDSAADNYPFMVLTAAMTDRPLMEGRLLDILRTEQRLTSRIDRLPDDYSFSKKGWRREKLDLDEIIFDGAEYVKDGLLYVAEWLGPSPWSERMTGITEDIWKNARIETPYGKLPTLNFEVNGDMLQACSRLYWFTGDRKYLDWAIRLGDYYLLGTNHPTRDRKELRLIDHGCEVVNGLTELYVAVSRTLPAKKQQYQQPLHEMLDCILAKGRNADSLLYTSFNPKTGEHRNDLCDTWGYDYDGFYTTYLLDKTEPYRDAVCQALGNLKGKYVGACWADKSADGYADSIEGAINLFNREPVPSAADWIDSQTRMMWAIQKPDGIIEAWHGDGNFARTSLMYALWKTQGATVQPWRADVRFGAVREGDTILLSLTADQPWEGRVVFDRPRHKEFMHLPLDYPRINQFPEWFTAKADGRYSVRNLNRNDSGAVTGKELRDGLPIKLEAGKEVRMELTPTK